MGVVDIECVAKNPKSILKSIQQIDFDLFLRLMLVKDKVDNGLLFRAIESVAQSKRNVKFLIGRDTDVTKAEVECHLNGQLENTNYPLFAINSVEKRQQCVDVALVQGFFGVDRQHVDACQIAARLMSMSNPMPVEWVFVECQKEASQAKFKWVSACGAKYIFIRASGQNQDYFMKEQLWNIGAKNTSSENLVFVDADVSYCQNDWLKKVDGTFKQGVRLFQPHAWSWRANEPTKDVGKIDLVESFGYKRKNPSGNLGHTGYDIAITRTNYNAIGGFPSVRGAGGDYLIWSMLGWKDEWKSWHPFTKTIERIRSKTEFPYMDIGCACLSCFHNAHGSQIERSKTYINDTSPNHISKTVNNYGLDRILEMPR